jgi:hypothetical protein
MSFFEEFCSIAGVPGSLCSFSSFAALNTSSYSWLHQKIPRYIIPPMLGCNILNYGLAVLTMSVQKSGSHSDHWTRKTWWKQNFELLGLHFVLIETLVGTFQTLCSHEPLAPCKLAISILYIYLHALMTMTGSWYLERVTSGLEVIFLGRNRDWEILKIRDSLFIFNLNFFIVIAKC